LDLSGIAGGVRSLPVSTKNDPTKTYLILGGIGVIGVLVMILVARR